MRRLLPIFLFVFPYVLYAQGNTTDIYGERKDTLASSVSSASSGASNISRSREVRTEIIDASGLCKMACCNLAESFENSASVTVGYSDAVTGARQIRLLGLSGVYTQMLDANRPIMRGIASPFGLGYVPGQWLNSIQIAKGAPSVVNGVESLTGQINLEHRKPTDEIPLFINAAFMSDTKGDFNIASSLQLNDKWSTVILGHISGNIVQMDHNGDSFADDPKMTTANVANRWLYKADNGTQVRFGFRYLYDTRDGGQWQTDAGWMSHILNRSFNTYFKVGVPLNEDNSRNIAFVGDYADFAMSGAFGNNAYSGNQMSGIGDILFQDHTLENHHFTAGLNVVYDHYSEMLKREVPAQIYSSGNYQTDLVTAGLFLEYTYHLEEKLTVVAGLRGDWYNYDNKFRPAPRLTVKYSPIEEIVLRLNGGRGLRHASPITDNIGVMSTGKAFFNGHTSGTSNALYTDHPLEDDWVVGGNITYYMPFGVTPEKTYISFDYFRTQFVNQMIVDYNAFSTGNIIDFYMLDGQSYTNTYQVDFAVEPVKRFTINATFRYTDAKVTMLAGGLQERPMTSRYKGVLNLQYATNLNKWIFDFTASINGPCRVYDFMRTAYPDLYAGGYSQVYPLLYLQVTHRMKGWDIYLGGENLTNYKQPNPIVNADQPFTSGFDASGIWGPIMGIKAYLGIRVTLWKKS